MGPGKKLESPGILFSVLEKRQQVQKSLGNALLQTIEYSEFMF